MTRLDFMACDRAYFKRHPKAEYRIRRIMPGEIPDSLSGELSAHTHVVVRQIAPGVRMRTFVTLPPELDGHKWTEADARTAWEGWVQLPVPDFLPPPTGEWPTMPLAPVVPLRGDKQ